ncbi:FmdB family transcriptional regulator [Duganella sp. BJB488]|nr:FmdB family transcriptional regulator [Duganella sp. BJB475]RFP13216.1 FmdB family transcriptional regulator [Duganella sp. BJB489]RFP17209.1 FmdB family transcriptional regulator [Duganella sp. BJB488]RFP25364.1 FmdB family transcriptional regulator [Duganella sp. BJB476]RFP31571.1 FmdB family transcriptional regulator [Duganella sp. BJB480]
MAARCKQDTSSSPSIKAAAPPAAGAAAVPGASSVSEAATRTQPRFLPVIRGDEPARDAQIKTEGDFGRAADATAREYGLDPGAFRAQLQVESGAFTQGYQKAMHQEGDLDRASDNNTSIGLGQISRKYLDGRAWSDGGPGNTRVGSQIVTTGQYEHSVTVQLRMAASNLAQRVADHGGLRQGLSYYVSGNADPGNASGASYLAKIDAEMKNPAVLRPGRLEA